MRRLLSSLLLLLTSYATSQTFNVTRTPTGAGPIQVHNADFNKDGKRDLVTLDQNGHTFSVLLGNGNSTFQAPKQMSTAENLSGLAVADMNNDGKTDVVSYASNFQYYGGGASAVDTISVYLGNGDGTFQSPQNTTLTVSGPATNPVAADFDHDGKQDIAVCSVQNALASDAYNTCWLFLGTGDGHFTGPYSQGDIGYHGDTQESPYRVTDISTGDFNHDGWQDIAAVECCGGFDVEMGDLRILYNASTTGTPSRRFVAFDVSGFSVPRSVQVMDINGDGWDDMVTPYTGCHTPCSGFRYFINNKDNTFAAFTNNEDDNYFGTARAGDFDFDGKREIAITVHRTTFGSSPEQDFVAFYELNADNTIASHKDVALGAQDENLGVSWLTANDWNNDSKLDLAASLGSVNAVSILTNTANEGTNGACPFGADNTVQICTPTNGGTYDSPVRVSASVASSAGVTGIRVYVDGVDKGRWSGPTIDVQIAMATGTHQVVVKAWNSLGQSFSKSVTISVGAGSSTCPAGPYRTVNLCAPASGGTYSSPVRVFATANSETSAPITGMHIYVDGVDKGRWNGPTIDTMVSMTAGNHLVVVKAWNSNGLSFSAGSQITVK
jgi:hypothetical protein